MYDVATTERQPAWWAVLLEGIAALVLGAFLLTSPAATLFALVVFIGAYWLVRGVIGIVDVFVGSHVAWGWRLFASIVTLLAGLFVLAYPLYSTALLPLVYVIVLGIGAVISGIAYIYHGATGGGGGSVAIGIFDLIVGFLLLGSPYVAALALPFALGILAVIGGLVLIVMSFSVRSQQHHAMPHGMAPA